MMKFKKSSQHKLPFIFWYPFGSVIIISLTILYMDVTEYLFTEYWYIWDKVNTDLIVYLLFVLLSLFAVFIPRQLKTGTFLFSLLSFMLVLSLHSQYLELREVLQKIPKVKKVDKNWTIQADRVTIYGKHFGGPHEPGEVRVGDLLFQIITWDENLVVAEQPVPHTFYRAPLIIENHYGNETLAVPEFQIRNPAELK